MERIRKPSAIPVSYKIASKETWWIKTGIKLKECRDESGAEPLSYDTGHINCLTGEIFRQQMRNVRPYHHWIAPLTLMKFYWFTSAENLALKSARENFCKNPETRALNDSNKKPLNGKWAIFSWGDILCKSAHSVRPSYKRKKKKGSKTIGNSNSHVGHVKC